MKLMLSSIPITLKDFRKFTRGIDSNTPIHIESRVQTEVTKLYYDNKKLVIGRK